MLSLIVLSSVSLTTSGTAFATPNYLSDILQALVIGYKLRSVHIICPEAAITKNILFREFSVSARFSYLENVGNLEDEFSVVYCVDTKRYSNALIEHLNVYTGTRQDWFVVGTNKNLKSIKHNSSVSVNQRVNFVSLDTKTITESYTVGHERVDNLVGHLVQSEKMKIVLKFKPDLKNFLERRSNLHSSRLRALTESILPYIFMPREEFLRSHSEGWIELESGQKTRDVSNEFFFGMLWDVLKMLKSDLNFTTDMIILKEKGEGFGNKINGTWTDLIGSMLRAEADFVFTAVVVTDMRYEVTCCSIYVHI